MKIKIKVNLTGQEMRQLIDIINNLDVRQVKSHHLIGNKVIKTFKNMRDNILYVENPDKEFIEEIQKDIYLYNKQNEQRFKNKNRKST